MISGESSVHNAAISPFIFTGAPMDPTTWAGDNANVYNCCDNIPCKTEGNIKPDSVKINCNLRYEGYNCMDLR